jgi:hypothetical protein
MIEYQILLLLTPFRNMVYFSILFLYYFNVILGIHNWELPIVRKPIANLLQINHELDDVVGALPGYRKKDEPVRWFCRLLLEGNILDETNLKQVFIKSNLKMPSATFTSLKVTSKVSNILCILIPIYFCT